ncbi:hypothetical protein MMF93_01650 [Streptomyces tubbatahanensis]|uniref:Uncharacterized protein n=1 Tax=Streptomyces tubbatahanensis TaxID=2923272 RepID=A0ABY3XLN2_9ACTN|nr:hypothetical protein [Streptomyces tubbatahanensis]UNS95314.1 hypothetical protein MMF93_01650 [Streptomyces tubbatahanensis]
MGRGDEHDGASISDEEWEQFLRDAESGEKNAPKEPSARARMVARRLREEPDRPTGWRTFEPSAQGGKTRRGTGRGAKRLLYGAGLLLALGLLVLALKPTGVLGWLPGQSDEQAPLAADSAAARQPTLREPFRGSPAREWSEGLAGITFPAPDATGWMSKAQVAQALESTRDFLAASSLESGVLRGERPERAIALINPQQRDVQDFLDTAFDSPSRKNNPLMLFSRFDPAKVRLAGDVVKTRGRVAFEEGEDGALEVTADVTYVYPVVAAEEGSDQVARTIVRRETVMSWDDPAKVHTKAGTFSLVSYRVDTTNGGCDGVNGYLNPKFGAQTDGEAARGPEVDPYDRDTSMDERMREAEDEDCGRATRT